MNARIPKPEVQDSDFGAFEAATATLDQAWPLPTDKSRAVAHYTALAAEAQRIRTQQARRLSQYLDWLDDDNGITDESLAEMAADELASDPAVVAEWIRDQSMDAGSIDVIRVMQAMRNGHSLTPAQAMAVVMCGSGTAASDALFMLREAFEAGTVAMAAERAGEIRREFEAYAQRVADEGEECRLDAAELARAA